ncbi:amidohydrolase family protein [Congregibacter litoralis]|uniref:Dihydroorotase n=1 Tax=Congregibacter litoralis KT71 TaxID=314285 RepID=A4AE19_9GAMM|nr:amidohydrolase family protein [Congregibacter litoralis]EAQ95767.2 dihydroorotase [Congregibacter litoralis KT71]
MDRSIKRKTVTAVLALAAFVLTSVAGAYDLVINNGRVMDPETGLDKVMNVGVTGDRIAAITEEALSGDRTIDASGKVVAPGFIDAHLHGNSPMAYKLALRDGLTTAMDLEYGTLGSAVNDWYAARKGKTQLNFGTASSHELARSLVLDGIRAIDVSEATISRTGGDRWAVGVPTDGQLTAILEEIDRGLAAGAVALGSTVGYMPGVSARELFEAQKIAAERGRVSALHTRHTPGTATTVPNGVQEVMANAAALQAPLLVMHFNNPGWELVQELILGMRDGGLNVWGEVYPYAAGSTTLNAVFLKPESWIEELGNRYEDTLFDPQTNSFLTEARYHELMAEDPGRGIVVYKMSPDSIPRWLRMEGITLGSDGMPVSPSFAWDTPYASLPNGHPRTAGARGRTLRIAREEGIPLMHVIAAMSYRPAKHLGATGLAAMDLRGRLQENMVADIVIFDPDTVTDNATYAQGMRPTTGIDYVLVSGRPTVVQGRVLPDVAAGKAIRFPVSQ